MTCDRCKRSGAVACDVSNTAGTDTEYRELCWVCITRAEDKGHSVEILEPSLDYSTLLKHDDNFNR